LKERFVGADWNMVYTAEQELERRGQQALPILNALLDREELVPLTDTADLIYPGAKTFYGHGWIVDYDLDRLSVRAGWALEELTFENFGFSASSIREPDLLKATMDGKRDTPLANVVKPPDARRRDEGRGAAVARAKAWYRKSGANWSRFQALRDALRSDDPFRQMKALGWLRYGATACRGLSLETYSNDIRPLVVHLKISSSDSGVLQQATLLLNASPAVAVLEQPMKTH
jgi:hypothetical protein